MNIFSFLDGYRRFGILGISVLYAAKILFGIELETAAVNEIVNLTGVISTAFLSILSIVRPSPSILEKN